MALVGEDQNVFVHFGSSGTLVTERNLSTIRIRHAGIDSCPDVSRKGPRFNNSNVSNRDWVSEDGNCFVRKGRDRKLSRPSQFDRHGREERIRSGVRYWVGRAANKQVTMAMAMHPKTKPYRMKRGSEWQHRCVCFCTTDRYFAPHR